MAFASIGSFVAASDHTAAQVWTFSPTTQINAGDIAVLLLANDNRASGADGDNKEVFAVDDSAYNTWTKARAFGNVQGAAAGGASVEIWWTLAQSNLPTSGSINVRYGLGSNVTAKAASGWRFSLGAGNMLTLVGTGQDLAQDAATAVGSLTLGSLANSEHLWIRATAFELNDTATAFTASAGFTAVTAATDTGSGTATSDMGVRGEFIIATATTETSAPTFTIASADWANTLVAFDEAAIPAGLDIPILQPSALFKDNRPRM